MGESPLQVRVLCAALNTKKTSKVLAVCSMKNNHVSTSNGGHMPGEDGGSPGSGPPTQRHKIKKGQFVVCMKFLISSIDAGARTQIGLMATVIGLLAYFKRDFHFSSCTTCQSTGTSCAAMAKIFMIGLV